MATARFFLPIPPHGYDPTNRPAFARTADGRPYLLFDGTTDELVLWTFRLPGDFSSSLVIKARYSMVSATTNNVAFRTEIAAIADGEAIDSVSFAAVEASTDSAVPGTAGLAKTISDTIATPTLAADDHIALRFGRENGTSGTNATGDMELWEMFVEYTTT